MSKISKKIDFLVEFRFPGVSEEIELRVIALAAELAVDETDDRVVEAIIREFSPDIRDVESHHNGDEPPTTGINAPGQEQIALVRAWINGFRSYRGMLEEMPGAELFPLYDAIKAPEREAYAQRNDRLDLDQFFNEPRAAANYDRWLSLAVWTPEEAVVLSLGKDPSVVNSKTLAGVYPGSPFKRTVRHRLDALNRAVEGKVLAEPILPKRFIIWAENQYDFAVPAQMIEKPGASKLKSSVEEQDTIDSRSRNSYLKIILGLAIKHYQFDKDYDGTKPSAVFQTISNDLAKISIHINADTVRKHLMDARAKASTVGYSNAERGKKIW